MRQSRHTFPSTGGSVDGQVAQTDDGPLREDDPALWVYRFALMMGRLVLGLALASFILGVAQVLLVLLIYGAGILTLRYAVSAGLKIAQLGKPRTGAATPPVARREPSA